ncbi:MAG: hypothetical protein JW719_00215 [Pirellulales bacterium]|nr:hypothetical protein [Pirellulales bacterium]
MNHETYLTTPTEIRWVVSLSANCFHAADAMRRGRRLANPSLARVLDEPVGRLQETVLSHGLDENLFWSHLVPLSAGIENNTRLVELALAKTIGPGGRATAMVGSLAGRVADVEAAVRRELPELVEQLAAGAEPMAARWHESGPALLQMIVARTDPRLAASRADVILVPAVSGGDGMAHLLYNTVWIEAVETDPEPRLPEVARLAWLIAQLNIDLPALSETIPRDRLPLVARAALLPAALDAAAEIQPYGADRPTISLALEHWRVAGPDRVDLADVLSTWWRSHLEMEPAWNVSLAALDRMIHA